MSPSSPRSSSPSTTEKFDPAPEASTHAKKAACESPFKGLFNPTSSMRASSAGALPSSSSFPSNSTSSSTASRHRRTSSSAPSSPTLRPASLPRTSTSPYPSMQHHHSSSTSSTEEEGDAKFVAPPLKRARPIITKKISSALLKFNTARNARVAKWDQELEDEARERERERTRKEGKGTKRVRVAV